MQLLLVRHAESLSNVLQEIQGQQESPLSDQGIQQALKFGKYLQTQTWEPSHVYVSPLERSRRTAELILEAFTLPSSTLSVSASPHLLEVHNGILQGLTWTAAQAQFPKLCADLLSTLDWVPIPQAESPQSVFERAKLFWDQMLPSHGDRDRVLIVTHGGFLQYLVAALLGCDRLWGMTIPPLSVFEFELNLNYWNVSDQNRFNPALCKILQFNQMHP